VLFTSKIFIVLARNSLLLKSTQNKTCLSVVGGRMGVVINAFMRNAIVLDSNDYE
jgi:hypothetical protein